MKKFFGLLATCLVSGLFGVCSLVQNNYQAEQTFVYETKEEKPRQDLFFEGAIAFVGISDLLSPHMITNGFQLGANDSTNLSYTCVWYYDLTRLVSNTYINNTDLGFANGTDIDTFHLICTSHVVSTNYVVNIYKLDIGLTARVGVTITFTCKFLNYTGSQYLLGIENVSVVNGNDMNIVTQNARLKSDLQTQESIDSQVHYDLGYEVGYTAGVSIGKDLGYNEGRVDGIEVGYNQGYAVGYDVGYTENLQGGANDVFTLIGKALNSANNILSIEILPNFPLAVLVFTPLLIAVIIVIVKMIHG